MTIWADIQTKNGFASDEVQSSLQKYIRRAKVEEACQAAYELYTSGPVFLDKMWSRLETIAVEDVGFGDLNVPVLIHALDQMRKNFPYNDGDQPMYFIHAIRVLCTCTKDRSSDYLKISLLRNPLWEKWWKYQISHWINTQNVDKKWDVDQNISLKKPQR